jgi:hypothetical protein
MNFPMLVHVALVALAAQTPLPPSPPPTFPTPPAPVVVPPAPVVVPPAPVVVPPAPVVVPPAAVGVPPAAVGVPPAAVGVPPAAVGVPPAAAVVGTPATAAAAATPAGERWLLLPVQIEGVDAPGDVTSAVVVGHKDLSVLTSSCGERETCRAEARLKGAGGLLSVRVRRLGSASLVVTATATDLMDASLGDAVDVGALTAAVATTRFAVDRLVSRVVRTRTAARDGDGDGVVDGDACPTLAGAASARGCPDADGDGVADDVDACPVTAGPAPTGCADRDGDGVSDVNDACPDVKGTTADGCGGASPPVAAGGGLPPPDAATKKPAAQTGPEWGRIVGGSAAGLLGTLVGGAAGAAAIFFAKGEIENVAGGAFTDGGTALLYGAGAGVGALFGSLAPDVACAGLCSYPLSASGWTRAVAAVAAGASAGAGAALGAIAFNQGDQQGLIAGATLLGAAPLLAGFTVAAGNCISGPPVD